MNDSAGGPKAEARTPSRLRRRGVLAAAPAAMIFAAGSARAAPSQAPLLMTRAGAVRGYRDKGISVFKGVRYGADTGPRRFQRGLGNTEADHTDEAPSAFEQTEGCRQSTSLGSQQVVFRNFRIEENLTGRPGVEAKLFQVPGFVSMRVPIKEHHRQGFARIITRPADDDRKIRHRRVGYPCLLAL